jgi:hypothetical protein
MASAIKSIGLRRSSQRIPAEKHKPSELFAAFWTLIYASTALLLVTTSIIVAACASLSDSAWGERLDRQSKS